MILVETCIELLKKKFDLNNPFTVIFIYNFVIKYAKKLINYYLKRQKKPIKTNQLIFSSDEEIYDISIITIVKYVFTTDIIIKTICDSKIYYNKQNYGLQYIKRYNNEHKFTNSYTIYLYNIKSEDLVNIINNIKIERNKKLNNDEIMIKYVNTCDPTSYSYQTRPNSYIEYISKKIIQKKNTIQPIDIFDKMKHKETFHYLFYGKPGTGKTTAVKYLLNKYKNYDIIFIDNKLIRDEKLFFDLYNIIDFNKNILFIDEIDKTENIFLNEIYEIKPDCKYKQVKTGMLYNILDGLLRKHNSKIVFCTNDINKLDKILFRPGRINNYFEFTGINQCNMYNKLYNYDD